MRGCLLLLALFIAIGAGPAAAAVPSMILDINQVPGTGLTAGVSGPLVPAGNRVVFPAFQDGSGVELWASNGTHDGTLLLRDSVPGPESVQFHPLGSIAQTAFFLAEHGFRERFQLWRSNGTIAGTFPLTDSAAGGPFMCFDLPRSAVGNFLFFTAAAPGSGCGLWRTDGTVAGTQLVLDTPSGSGGDPEQLTPAAGRLFFVSGQTLWVSDGTEAGTREVQTFDFNPQPPRELTSAGSRVFFLASERDSGEEELWTSDGTVAGTRTVTDFFEPLPFRPEPYDSLLGLIGGTFYFLANDGTGLDLWRTDGTGSEVRRVTDFVSTQPFPERFDATQLARLGNLLVFQAREDSGPLHLWVSSGTPETTREITDCPGGCPDVFTELIQVGNRIVLTGTDPEHGEEIWVTDGTGAGTRRITDLCSGACSSIFSDLFLRLGKVFFIGPGSSSGFAVWTTDGTAAGTVRLANLGNSPFGFQNDFSPVTAGTKVFFAADPGNQGAQLWVSDGTPAGTRQVSDLGSDPGSSPVWFTPFAGGVLFNAYDGSERHLWRSQGTAASTVEIQASGEPIYPPVVSSGLAWFLRKEAPSVGSTQVWRTDGSESGTVRVSPVGIEPFDFLVPFREGAVFLAPDEDDPFRYVFWETDSNGTRRLFEPPTFPRFVRTLGQDLYFVALQGDFSSDDQLWVSDGTQAGTRALTEFHDYAFDFQDPPEMARVGGTVFFTAHRRLWKTDGTKAGTVPVLPATLEGSQPTSFVEFRGALFFIGATAQGAVGRGLWRSDGTAAGTFLVKAVGPPNGNIRPEPAWPTVVGDRLFFVADDGAHGSELWSTDGTTAGTVLVRDIAPGAASSKPAHLVGLGGRLYFAATDGSSGIELWESDGTAVGTRLVDDILPGAGSSNPTGLTVSGNRLYFSAVDGIHGEEPWVLSLQAGACVPSAEALCLGGRFRVEADWNAQGNQGKGRVVALTADTGYFWFFDPANVEVVLKVLDGRGINGHYWVFYGALSNVAYTLTVTDTRTGAVKRYQNPAGRLASVADTQAFPQGAASVVETVMQEPALEVPPAALDLATEAGTCAPSSTRLCLNGGRFSVQARWRAQGSNGFGQAVPLEGGDTGYFWFFDAANVEVVLKVLDGRPVNGKFWVFYGALSNVEYTLIVTDTVTGQVKRYRNPAGRLASVADTGAF